MGLGRAKSLMRKVIQMDELYRGPEGPTTREHRRIYEGLKQGRVL